ncbi:hypothetical protein DYQ86_09760 [Acidobacteria bacterium AB60]|nr:hypothetical protein DYQ86_09760 [Acidobacteria bacterium AB60]
MKGYWRTHFESGAVQGDGIAILHDGQITGSDREHVWTGTYEEVGPVLSAHIRIVPSVSCEEKEILARDQPVIYALRGYCTTEFARLEGAPEHREGQRVVITMRKCKGGEMEVGAEAAHDSRRDQ